MVMNDRRGAQARRNAGPCPRQLAWNAPLALLVAGAAAPAQGADDELAPLPLQWSAEAGATGVAVEVVDATTGLPIGAARVAWVGDVPRQDDGSWRLGRSKAWFEASAEGYLTRRDSFGVPPAADGGRLRVPLLPRVIVLCGRIEPAWPCAVDVGDAKAAIGDLAAVRCDADGRFLAMLRPGVERVTVTARAVGRVFAAEVEVGKTHRRRFGPFRDVECVAWDEVLHAPAETVACLQKYGPRFAASNRGELRPASWSQAIDAGLAWLAAHQDEDGGFDPEHFMQHDKTGAPCDGAGQWDGKVGVTGLVMLAFLADGNTPAVGRYREQVARGTKWLLAQNVELGEEHPLGDRPIEVMTTVKGERYPGHYIYEHCLATEAVCEAVGLGGLDDLRPRVQAAVDTICRHRNPYSAWRYKPVGGDNDMSITCRAVLALVAARDFGFRVEDTAFQYGLQFARDMTDSNGRAGYHEKGGLSARLSEEIAARFPWDRTESMTAAGLLVRSLAVPGTEDPARQASLSLLAKRPPVWRNDGKGSGRDFYYWALGAQAVASLGPNEWKRTWSRALTAVVKEQRTDGAFAGSFDPVGAWCEKGGRVYATAMLLLALQAPTRYAR